MVTTAPLDNRIITVRKFSTRNQIPCTSFQMGTSFDCFFQKGRLDLIPSGGAPFSEHEQATVMPYGIYGHGRCIRLHQYQADMLNWKQKDYLSVRKGDAEGSFSISKATPEEISAYAHTYPKQAVSGQVRNGRYLYLTKEQRKFLGLPNINVCNRQGSPLKVTLDLRDKALIRLEPMSESDRGLPKQYTGGYKNVNAYCKYQFSFRHYFSIPAPFVRKCGFKEAVEPVQIREDGNALLIYRELPECELCGSRHTSEFDFPHEAVFCGECANTFPDVTQRVHAAGDVLAAARNAKDELKAALQALNDMGV